MSRLIWKELREHYKLALLVMLGLGATQLAALCGFGNEQNDTYYYHGMTLTRDTFLLVTTFGSAAAGLLFGFLQILPELKTDRWAALLHRPTPRGHLFLGKAFAGILLYSLATIPPFLLCTWLAATPGHFPLPFVPELCLAGIADTFAGLLYYFAALLIALQRGGGFGLRALPLLAAVHVTTFVTHAVEFSDAVGAVALMLVALGFAAWGAMMNRDSFRARSWPARLALLTVAFYGLCGIVSVIDMGRQLSQTYDYTGANYEITDEGRPIKLIYKDGFVVATQELDGRTPTNPDFKPDRVQSHARYLNGASGYIGDSHGAKRSTRWHSYRAGRSYLEPSDPYSYPQPEQWFEIVKDRTLVGMSIQAKMPVARLDEHGFQPMTGPLTPFPKDVDITVGSEHSYCLWSPNRIRFADLPSRKILDAPLPSPGPIYGTANAYAGTVRSTAFALRTAMAFYDAKKHTLLALIPYHQDVERWGQTSAGIAPSLDRFYVWYRPSNWIPYKTRLTLGSYFEETDAQGNVLHSYTLPPLPESRRQPGWFNQVETYGRSSAFFFGTMLYQKVGGLLGNKRLGAAFDAHRGENARSTLRIGMVLLLVSAACTGVTFYWARRVQFAPAQAWRWAALAFAFNTAGLIIFRLASDWPRFVACARCQRQRPIHLTTCPHCAEGWPAMAPNGTEIFDNMEMTARKSVTVV